jgi:3-hydroxybutyryl-CoA dehydrogenase
MLQIETVAVVGASEAGTACAVLAALAGCSVRVFDGSDTALERAFEEVRSRVELAFAAGALTGAERQRVLDGVLFTPDLDEALTGADLAVDAGACEVDDLEGHLASALRVSAAVAAAGPESADALAARLPQPGRVFTLALDDVHGPVPRLRIVASYATSGHVVERALAFAERVNRVARTARPLHRTGSR